MKHHPRSRIRDALLAVIALAGAASGALAQPANDSCANAIAIGNATVSGTTVAATNDGSAACGASASNADVWYRYTASATTTISASSQA